MADRIGQRLGNYQLLSLLGHGGFADVYLGDHIYIKTQAAIKVLHAQLEREDIEKFRNEAQTIAHLIHPHIVRVLDFDVDDYTPFLVMDYAPNGTLRKRHPKGIRLPASIVVPYVKQLASALQYAHDQKLIHRDVKPENMLLGRNNEVLLSDFGIALIAQSSHSQSTEDMVTGTMSYMAPEQIQGRPRPASDQYSLAVAVYEWLTGVKPFSGSYMEIVTQHLSASPPPLHDKVHTIPLIVEQVVLKALAKDYHDRYTRVQDFADAFEQACQLKGPTIGSPPLVVKSRPLQDDAAKRGAVEIPPTVVARPLTPVQGYRVQQQQQPPSVMTPHVQSYQTRQAAMMAPPSSFAETPSTVSTSARKIGKGIKRGVGVLLTLILLLGVLICGGSYVGYNYVVSHYFTSSAATDTTGAKAEADDFVYAISIHNYDQAYNDLSSQITKQDSRVQFKQKANIDDRCYGPITNYKSVGSTSQGNALIYKYTITRAHLRQAYQLHVSVQQNSSGNWQVIDYNVDSSRPACS
ncbi:MAG: hypothetical protein NVSMB33_10860 [Ktedonobacteraceae bacterium]